MIEIDGSYGEGGGQILRTSLALASITGQPVRLFNIRAARPKPGLQPQHLTSVRAAAAVCDAELDGAGLGSQVLVFRPRHAPQAGEYVFDVTEAAGRGSAGAASLIFQTVLLPLAMAGAESRVTIRGGTHVPHSPPFPYIRHVYLPALWRMGIRAQVELKRYGWYPAGEGEMEARIQAVAGAENKLAPIVLTERGELRKIWGTAAVSNLPAHIAQRMASRAANLLKDAIRNGAAKGGAANGGVKSTIEAAHVEATGPGAGIFIFVESERSAAGFTAYGHKGLPSEQVAAAACHDAISYMRSSAAVDMHLADQLVLPAVLAAGQSRWTTCRVTQHLLTNAWIVRHFTDVAVDISGAQDQPGEIVLGRNV